MAANETALTDVAIRAYSYGEALGLVFFGFTLLSVGYLIRHSGYLPRLLGVLLHIAGVSYVVNSFLVLVAPRVANIAFLIPSFVAEMSLALWLLAKASTPQIGNSGSAAETRRRDRCSSVQRRYRKRQGRRPCCIPGCG